MVKKIPVGKIMETNCYIVFDEMTKEAIVIDPGYPDEAIVKFVEENNLKVMYIYLTHCHFDHILGAKWLKDRLKVPIACLDKEEANIKDENITMGKELIFESVTLTPDKLFFENDEIQIGNLNFKLIHTPGHTSGSSCLYGDGVLISGDTLFKGTYGRCDLPTGNLHEIIKSINTKLFELPADTVVFPGHGENTTIGTEKNNSEFF